MSRSEMQLRMVSTSCPKENSNKLFQQAAEIRQQVRIVGDNSPRLSPVSTCLQNRNVNSFAPLHRLFMGGLQSEQPEQTGNNACPSMQGSLMLHLKLWVSRLALNPLQKVSWVWIPEIQPTSSASVIWALVVSLCGHGAPHKKMLIHWLLLLPQ